MIESFIEETNRAKTKEEVYQHFQTTLANLGYDRLTYCYATDQPKLNRKAEFGIVSTYPQEWLEYYNQSNFMAHDPIVKQLFLTNGAFAWESIVSKLELTEVQLKIMNEAENVGINSGIGVGIHQCFNEISGLGIASSYKRKDHKKDTVAQVNLLAFQFHEAYSSRNHAQQMLKKIDLSKREKEILHWMYEGKSDIVIADLLYIQHSTVRYHIKNIYLKLGVNNRTMAVVKALKLGLICPTFVQTPYQG